MYTQPSKPTDNLDFLRQLINPYGSLGNFDNANAVSAGAPQGVPTPPPRPMGPGIMPRLGPGAMFGPPMPPTAPQAPQVDNTPTGSIPNTSVTPADPNAPPPGSHWSQMPGPPLAIPNSGAMPLDSQGGGGVPQSPFDSGNPSSFLNKIFGPKSDAASEPLIPASSLLGKFAHLFY